LDFNEKTTPVPSHITDALKAHLDTKGVQTYPFYAGITANIADYAGVTPDECLITNGSDQGIDLVIRACCPTGTEAIIPAPTFPMYEQTALSEGLLIKRPNFTREHGFPTAEVLAAINDRTSLVVFGNPNNPTGTAIPRDTILDIARKAPHCCMLVDECYFEYMAPETSVKDEVSKIPNLFVTRTFSKTWGMPSLRLGYILSAPANINSLGSVRGPYDVNQLAIAAVAAALADRQYMLDFVSELNERAKPKFEDFLRSRNITFWPSSANFIFCYFSKPLELEAGLRARKILVRPKKDADGVQGLRVTVGTVEQTERLIAALEELMPVTANGIAKSQEPAKKRKIAE